MNKSREQFEDWFKKEFDSELTKYGEKLVNFVKSEQFKIWQASRESLEIELPKSELKLMTSTLTDTIAV